MRGMFVKKYQRRREKRYLVCIQFNIFGATMFMLGNIESAFAPLGVIQIAGFLMTFLIQYNQFYQIVGTVFMLYGSLVKYFCIEMEFNYSNEDQFI